MQLTIDNHAMHVPSGYTLLQAACEHGIHIPTLCYLESPAPYAACRLCLVELVSPRGSKLVASCAYPCEEGLVVRTNSPMVLDARRTVFKLLMTTAGHLPAVQALARDAERGVSSYVTLESDDCILCGRARKSSAWRDQFDAARDGARGQHTVPHFVGGLYRVRRVRARASDRGDSHRAIQAPGPHDAHLDFGLRAAGVSLVRVRAAGRAVTGGLSGATRYRPFHEGHEGSRRDLCFFVFFVDKRENSMDVSITGLYDLINREAQDDAALIAALEGIQARYRHLPFEALVLASERLGVPLSQANSATKHPVGLMNWLARQLAQPFAM